MQGAGRDKNCPAPSIKNQIVVLLFRTSNHAVN